MRVMAHIVELTSGDLLVIRRVTPIDEGDGFIEALQSVMNRLDLGGLLILGPDESIDVADDRQLASLGLRRIED